MFAQKFECFQKIIIIVGSKLAVSQTERFSKVIGQMDKKSSLIRQRKRKRQQQKLGKLWLESSFDTFQSGVILFVKDLNQYRR